MSSENFGRKLKIILGDVHRSKWRNIWFKVKKLIKSYFCIMKDRNYLLLLSSWALIQGFFQTFLILFVRQVRPTLTENININIGFIMLIVFVRKGLKNHFKSDKKVRSRHLKWLILPPISGAIFVTAL